MLSGDLVLLPSNNEKKSKMVGLLVRVVCSPPKHEAGPGTFADILDQLIKDFVTRIRPVIEIAARDPECGKYHVFVRRLIMFVPGV
jgi:hypothetical protein